MTAPYKLALAAGALLLLIVISSLILRSENDPADLDPTGQEIALNDRAEPVVETPPTDPVPPADDPRAGFDGLDLASAPIGPPRRDDVATPPDNGGSTRLALADEPAVEEPIEPDNSMTVGRPPFTEDDPFNRTAFDPLDEPVSTPEPEVIDVADNFPPAELPEPADDSPAEANTGIALGPIDPVGRGGQADDPPPAPPPGPAILRLYTVESGDSMSSIALATYGNANKWVDIAQANPLVDPNRLRIGQEIKLPDLDGTGDNATADAADSGGSSDSASGGASEGDDLPRRGATYIVKAGDNLSNIAKQFYGSSSKWELIYQANRREIGDNPSNLQLGMELLIPPPDTGAN